MNDHARSKHEMALNGISLEKAKAIIMSYTDRIDYLERLADYEQGNGEMPSNDDPGAPSNHQATCIAIGKAYERNPRP